MLEKYARPSWYRSAGLTTDQMVAIATYILMAILHAVLSYLQWRFGNQLLRAIRNEDIIELNRCFRSIRIFSIMRGIIALLVAILLLIAVFGLSNANI
jgi:hypothetical protein